MAGVTEIQVASPLHPENPQLAVGALVEVTRTAEMMIVVWVSEDGLTMRVARY
jgi:hypothetical protein